MLNPQKGQGAVSRLWGGAVGARAAASEHPLEPSAGTTGGRGLGHVPWAGPRAGGRGPVLVGGAGATCRWAGRGGRARARGQGVGDPVPVGGAGAPCA